MWSLPDINRMNERAAQDAKINKKKTEKQLCRGQVCGSCEKKATHASPYYDVFSDDPKGYIYQCEQHWEDGINEGFFHCDQCGHFMVENYTWENYFYNDPITGEQTCLNCALDNELEDPDNWISSPDEVTWDKIIKSQHLIPVEGHHWEKSLRFIGNVEFDSMSGVKLYSTREAGVQDMKDLVKSALDQSDKCIIIMDGAYQFAVSIGVYVKI
jgi:hypothetical protein